MNRIVYTLLLLLIAQLALLGNMYWTKRESIRAVISASLADTGPFLIDEIRISDSQDNSSTLAKQGSKWVIPGLDGLPADNASVEDLLVQLTETDPGWSVAHTLPARQRFQVADYHFRRRIELMAQGQMVSTVYLGTSPGFRKVHARNGERDDIYSLSLNLFDTSTRADQWMDRSLLQIRAPVQITTDNYSLNRSGGDWRLGQEGIPQERELEALLGALRNLQVEGVASEADRDELAFAEAALILQVKGLAREVRLELYALEKRHYIISSEHALPFKLSAYSFDQLTGIDAKLLSGAQ